METLFYKNKSGQLTEFNFSDYQFQVGLSESGNDYEIKNSIGAMGRYQFITTTANAIRDKYNLDDWQNWQYFKIHHSLQDTYFYYLVKDNLSYFNNSEMNIFLNDEINAKRFDKFGSSKVNIYGIMAGAHLAGMGNVKKYFYQGIDRNDGVTYISDYIVKFSKLITDNESFFSGDFTAGMNPFIVAILIGLLVTFISTGSK